MQRRAGPGQDLTDGSLPALEEAHHRRSSPRLGRQRPTFAGSMIGMGGGRRPNGAVSCGMVIAS